MITIINYKAGNLASVKRALDYLKIECRITDNPETIKNSKKIIFPGVGNAVSAMEMLKASGIDEAIKYAFNMGIPILGICLGTQIILSKSEEGNTECLGLIKGVCPKFKLNNKFLKIPHMGWNKVKIVNKHKILADFNENTEMYFVHSYYPQPDSKDCIYGTTEYEMEFPSIIGKDNLIATQFHLEKSGQAGLNILKNFAQWDGKNAD